ncbi:UNVERIFIED_CONTAM: hypothetical protein Sradi_6928300 [Sesamum radiatum]|uniref:Uncharacterized protein n=1 Tax=Sesamum radiatum TaxID=300843 RepID=A0AAW2JGR1_SESRA
MLPNSPKTLCSLTHSTHTDVTVSNAEFLSTQVDCLDGLHEDGGGSVLHTVPTPSPGQPTELTKTTNPAEIRQFLKGTHLASLVGTSILKNFMVWQLGS